MASRCSPFSTSSRGKTQLMFPSLTSAQWHVDCCFVEYMHWCCHWRQMPTVDTECVFPSSRLSALSGGEKTLPESYRTSDNPQGICMHQRILLYTYTPFGCGCELIIPQSNRPPSKPWCSWMVLLASGQTHDWQSLTTCSLTVVGTQFINLIHQR